MDEHDILARWCRREGLGMTWHDVWGQPHEASRQTLQRLLAELGVQDTSSEALDAAEARDRTRPLPPVAVVSAGAAEWTVPLHGSVSDTPVRWALAEVTRAPFETGVEGEDNGRPGRIWRGEARLGDAASGTGGQLCVRLALEPGYYRLSLDTGRDAIGDDDDDCLLIAAPDACWQPEALNEGARLWGLTVQLYALRSARNWGIGDFGDLAGLIEDAARQGAAFIGLNPLHALFLHNPAHVSPYSPSSRSQLNVLYVDVEAVPEFAACEAAQQVVRDAAFQRRLAGLRAREQVDHAGVAAAKLEVLRLLYDHFRTHHLEPEEGDADGGAAPSPSQSPSPSPRGAAFRAFQARGGAGLRLHAAWEALQGDLQPGEPWPQAWRDPDGPAVRGFIAEQRARVEFHEYLQWLADSQLTDAADRARRVGMPLGLYLDLAVSADRAGSDAWRQAPLYALGASVGAPPDEFNPNGQNWGLPPLRPRALREQRHAFFIETLRACMRHAGALRIDHVMGLMRLFWIPPGPGGAPAPARDGCYVHYPLDELMAIVALESHRCRCLVVGEDLGTVADEMRAALARHRVLSYRLLYFERDGEGRFRPPSDYPPDALVAVSTHDLATLAGWWEGRDLAQRWSLGLFPSREVYEQQVAGRAEERMRLLLALERDGRLPSHVTVQAGAAIALDAPLRQAIQLFLAATPSKLLAVQVEDALGVEDQANMPGTVDEHPNWRRRLPVDVEPLFTDPALRELTQALSRERPRTAGRRTVQARVPRATYRLQLHRGFGFDDAIAVLPYLKRLGISHVYTSPIMRARPGSAHGYDIVAHDEINPELGGHEGFERFAAALQREDLSLLPDIVPNHMGVLGGDNPWWLDVLEDGPLSPYAGFFDIDWHPVNRELDGKVLLPVLGDHYGAVLESGQLQLDFDPGQGSLTLRYFDHRFPLDPCTYAGVLHAAAACLAPPYHDAAGEAPSTAAPATLPSAGGPVDAATALASLAAAFGHLPAQRAGDDAARVERRRDKAVLKARLAALARDDSAVAAAVQAAAATFSEPEALDALHRQQAWRLAFWRVAADEINYRRFFDINELAALRMEDPAVFEATHRLVLDLAAQGRVDGLRIDHADGLYDPAAYFQRLQQGYAQRLGAADASSLPLYVVAEKITALHEQLPEGWALHGTTGYRHAALVNGLFVDAAAAPRFDRIWQRFSGEGADFGEIAYQAKKQVMQTSLAAELTMLATALLRVARAHRRTRDYTFNTLRDALMEVAACLPVYRTYLTDEPSAQDLRYLDWALAHARRRSQGADASVFDFLRRSLLGQADDGTPPAQREAVRHFARRFQQFTAPVTAKGVEDTACYRYLRLVSLNEVGGDPAHFGTSVKAFHHASAQRAARWPATLLATSTHDTKRSEDVRCRIDVLSEMPATWRIWLRRWSTSPQLQRAGAAFPAGEATAASGGATAAAATDAAGGSPADAARPSPSRSDEYLLFQTLLGTLPPDLDDDGLPAYRERIQAYMRKAAREAKLRTSWLKPDEDYERALAAFIDSILVRMRPNPLLGDLLGAARHLAWLGAWNSIATTVLKLTAPGVPDLYQGSELIDLSLVDPDNRRPVDYALRERWLGGLACWQADAHEAAGGMAAVLAKPLHSLAQAPQDGRLKLWCIWRLLQLREREAALFRDGGYLPLAVQGERADHVVAFARRHAGRQVVVVCGRLFARLLGLSLATLPAGESAPPPATWGRAWGDTAVVWPPAEADTHPSRDGARDAAAEAATPVEDVLTGRVVQPAGATLPLADLLDWLPVAVLAAPAAP